MKIKFDFHPCLTFHGWKDYNYCHILPRMTLFTAPRWHSNWDEKLIGQHFDFTIGWLVFEISIGMECLWKEPAKPKFNVGDHICCSDCSHAVVEAVNFDKGNDGHRQEVIRKAVVDPAIDTPYIDVMFRKEKDGLWHTYSAYGTDIECKTGTEFMNCIGKAADVLNKKGSEQ